MSFITSTIARFPGRFVTAWEMALWIIGRRKRFKVVNISMVPTLLPGDFVLAHPGAYANTLPQPGELVLARHPQTQQTIVKRVQRQIGEDIWLSSDNQIAGSDSQHFGAISKSAVIGRVTAIVREPSS